LLFKGARCSRAQPLQCTSQTSHPNKLGTKKSQVHLHTTAAIAFTTILANAAVTALALFRYGTRSEHSAQFQSHFHLLSSRAVRINNGLECGV
jgi:hypothetical protein